MLPSLVAEDLRASLTSFLGTTFALGDDDVRAELERFVADPDNGVFRGPFVRLRLPFRPAGDEWRAHPHAAGLTATPCSLSDLAQDLVPSWVTTTVERHAVARHAVALVGLRREGDDHQHGVRGGQCDRGPGRGVDRLLL